MNSPRFASPTSGLDPEQLLEQSRRTLAIGLAAAMGVHLALVAVNPFTEALERAPRPLTTRFIKRQPRLTKPLELRKVPEPQRQLIERKMQLVKPQAEQVLALTAFDTRGLLGQVATPSAGLVRRARSTAPVLEPRLSAAAIAGTRVPASKVDLALEMLDIDAMDSGRYQAMVIQDQRDPQSVRGFVKIARIYSQLQQSGDQPQVLRTLVDHLNWYTGIQAEYVGVLTYDDQALLEVPVLIYYISGDVVHDHEMAMVARYLKAGGFIFGHSRWSEALTKYGGLVEGRDFHYGRIPDDHAIFNSFFPIGGVPTTSGNTKQQSPAATYMRGLWIGDRLAAVEGLSLFLLGHGTRIGHDTTRFQQLAVNVMVYALTQEGSITQRLMEMVE